MTQEKEQTQHMTTQKNSAAFEGPTSGDDVSEDSSNYLVDLDLDIRWVYHRCFRHGLPLPILNSEGLVPSRNIHPKINAEICAEFDDWEFMIEDISAEMFKIGRPRSQKENSPADH